MIAAQEIENLLRMTHPTRSLMNNGHNVHKPNPHSRNRVTTQSRFVGFVDIRVTQPSCADTETRIRKPKGASRTNARKQMKVEALEKISNSHTRDSSTQIKQQKPAATPPTPEMKPTTPIP